MQCFFEHMAGRPAVMTYHQVLAPAKRTVRMDPMCPKLAGKDCSLRQTNLRMQWERAAFERLRYVVSANHCHNMYTAPQQAAWPAP